MLNKVPDSLKTLEPERPQYYRVNRGDNLYAISSRLGVSLNDLLVENNISRTSIIREGQILRIPGKTTPAVALASAGKNIVNTSTASSDQSTSTESGETEAIIEIAQAEAKSIIPPEEKVESKDITVVIPQQPVAKTVSKRKAHRKVSKETPPVTVEEINDSLKTVAMTRLWTIMNPVRHKDHFFLRFRCKPV